VNTLFLIPSMLAEDALHTIPSSVKDSIQLCDVFIVENLKTARRFIKAVMKEKDIDGCEFIELDKHNNYRFDEMPLYAYTNKNIGLLSEAGTPCIADPGNKVVALAHELNWKVIPLSGPSSIILALMASGFNGQQFTFNGYLPIEAHERKARLLQMEISGRKGHTQLFMDTPYRNMKLLDEIIQTLKYDTMLCIACNITAKDEMIKTLPISEWKKRKPDLHKKPCIFVLG
jgi:16S rRNA (cytidine1402-2'-O)-methyltransferase